MQFVAMHRSLLAVSGQISLPFFVRFWTKADKDRSSAVVGLFANDPKRTSIVRRESIIGRGFTPI
jgi:hypothetical protein